MDATSLRRLILNSSMIDAFPSIDAPDRCDSSVSSDEESARTSSSSPSNKRVEDKTARDVMIFSQIAKQLPPKSLLHLLKALTLSSEDDELHESFSTRSTASSTASPITVDYALPITNVLDFDGEVPEEITCKSVRFYCGEKGKIRRKVRYFATESNPDLWWSNANMSQIRRTCSKIVSEYRSHGEGMILAYLRLQKQNLTSQEFRQCRETLSTNFETRGLEHHVASVATQMQHRRYMQIVLNAQKSSGDAEEIGKVARKASLPSRQMAQRLAICDYHAAMQVHMNDQDDDESDEDRGYFFTD